MHIEKFQVSWLKMHMEIVASYIVMGIREDFHCVYNYQAYVLKCLGTCS
jgi:hypothetical protein